MYLLFYQMIIDMISFFLLKKNEIEQLSFLLPDKVFHKGINNKKTYIHRSAQWIDAFIFCLDFPNLTNAFPFIRAQRIAHDSIMRKHFV